MEGGKIGHATPFRGLRIGTLVSQPRGYGRGLKNLPTCAMEQDGRNSAGAQMSIASSGLSADVLRFLLSPSPAIQALSQSAASKCVPSCIASIVSFPN